MTNRNMFEALDTESTIDSVISDPDPFSGFDLTECDLDALEEVVATVDYNFDDLADQDDFLGGDAFDILDILGQKETISTVKPNLVRKHYGGFDVRAIKRKFADRLNYQSLVRSEYQLISEKNNVYLIVDNERIKCGKTKFEFNPITILQRDYIEMASILSEETATKGTCLGYSSLCHSAVCCMLLSEDDVLEPIEGHDVVKNGTFFEITGYNYNKRKTNADVLINKYVLLYTICSHYPDAENIIELSNKEDTFDSTGFANGAFDQPRSPYSDVIDRLHEQTRWFDTNKMEFLYKQVRSWFCRKPPVVQDSKFIPPDPTSINEALIRGSKLRGDEHKLPSPFRILAGPPLPEGIGENLVLLPQLQLEASRTTFHTMPLDYDFERVLIAEPEYKVEVSLDNNDSFFIWLYNSLLKFAIFQSIYIEAELLSKIVGKKGCFWSKYSNAGITWSLIRSNSMTYYVGYYRKSKPNDDCGEWAIIDRENDIWRSPTFKISLTDIEHAKVLPHRIYTTCASVIAYTSKPQRAQIMTRIMVLSATMKSSTWQTSALAGDMRFITLCTCSETGDLKSMVDKAASKVIKPLSAPDSIFLLLIKKFASNFATRDKSTTPIVGLPLRFMSLEKDLPSTMMWHMRKGDHATECFRKLVKGVHQEKDNRMEIINCLNMQSRYIDKFFGEGVTQNDFDEMMSQMPTTPYYNHIFFMALSCKTVQHLDAGKRQDPTQVNLKNLVSDHHSTMIDKPSELSGAVITTPRVADGLNSLLQQYHNPNGIHKLLTRMRNGPKLTNIFTIHPKDSKSKNREIPQMTNYMRATQFVSESLLTIYTDAEESDMMQNTEKYSEFCESFSEVISKSGLSRSEDKEFFCGYMQPECMSLCTLVVAIITGSTSIVTASAIQRCNKSRWTLLPKECDESIIDGIEERKTCFVKQGKTASRSLAILNYIHMMQGVYAIGAALVNTVFTVGLDFLQKEILVDVEKTFIYTTSDDSVRGVIVKKDNVYNAQQVKADYINSAPLEMHHCMMKDSTEKPIESETLAEFNNVAVGPSGMYPQQFIHSHLCIQPLLGWSVIEDIVNCVSNARMSLTWGDSIDLARAALNSNIMLLQQKWLLTQFELDKLYDVGLLPKCDEEIISGMGKLDDNIKLKLFRMLDDECKMFVISGEMKLIDSLRVYKLKGESANQKPRIVKYLGDLVGLRTTFEQINRSRRIKNKINIGALKQFDYGKRRQTKNILFEQLSKPEAAITLEEKRILDDLPKQPDIKIIPCQPRRSSFKPSYIGSSIKIKPNINLKGIIAKRLLNINITKHLNENEQHIANLTQEEYDLFMLKYQQEDLYKGLAFKSPSGRSLMKLHNKELYNGSMCFNYVASLEYPCEEPSNMTFGGTRYDKVIPCFYGYKMLEKADKQGCMLAFAFCHHGDLTTIFFQKKRGRPMSHTIDRNDNNFVIIEKKDVRVLCPLKKDLTPIADGSYNMEVEKPYNPLLTGDPDALLNYGNFMNTSARSAIKKMRVIFNTFDSNFPHQLAAVKPSFPYHLESSVEITYARINFLKGSRAISKLRLIPGSSSKERQVIDLTGQFPVISEERTNTYEDDWD